MKAVCGENVQYFVVVNIRINVFTCALYLHHICFNMFQDTTIKMLGYFSHPFPFPFNLMISSYRNQSINLHYKSLDGYCTMETFCMPEMGSTAAYKVVSSLKPYQIFDTSLRRIHKNGISSDQCIRVQVLNMGICELFPIH